MLRDFGKEKFDIIIQAGQSNAQGCGFGAVEDPFAMSADVLSMTDDFTMGFTIDFSHEEVWGNEVVANYAIPFARQYIRDGKLAAGRRILILRTAVGGTGFLDNHWKLQDDLFLRMMEMIRTALSLNPENRLIALLWHQGETDASFGADTGTHYRHLSTLVKAVRDTFSCDSLPFIAGDFVSEWKNANIEICLPVIQAIKDVCSDIGSARFVETADLQSNNQKVHNGDTIHFCREAQYSLGLRYYDAYRVITG